MSANNKFKNTYIKTDHLSVDELNDLTKKYSEASGYPLESAGYGAGRCDSRYEYVASVVEVDAVHGDPRDAITATDDLDCVDCHKSELKEITEKDLDDYLSQSKAVEDQIKYVGCGDLSIDPSEYVVNPINIEGKYLGSVSISMYRIKGVRSAIRIVRYHSTDGSIELVSSGLF